MTNNIDTVKLKKTLGWIGKILKKPKNNRTENWQLFVMLIPGLIWYFIFKYLPIYGVTIAFKDFSIVDGLMKSPWANPWYKYFEMFYSSPYFIQILSNTVIISFYKLVFGFFPPIILAILLNECASSRFKKLVQTITYMPHFLSWVIIYGMLLAFFSENYGLVNRMIIDAGGKSIPILNSPELFRGMLVSSEIWQGMGWGAIIYLAAITGIDQSLFESAKIDGCGRFKQIWYITLPGIRSIIVMLLILRVGTILDAGFDQIFIMYNIQVYSVADIVDTWVYRTGLQQMNFSLASAVGLFKSVIGFILVITVNKFSRKWGENIW